MRRFSTKFLVVYSGVLTLALATVMLTGFGKTSQVQHFDQITVHRINVVEPDGKLRLVISDEAEFPGSFVQGKEIQRPDRKATGMLFLDDESTEMGGLIFGGNKDKDGKISTNGHLSFDQYMQDQIFSIDAGREGQSRWSAITISDRGDYPITDVFDLLQKTRGLPEAERKAAWQQFAETHPGDHGRVVLGRAPDDSAVLRLKDPQGHDRILLKVDGKGQPALQLLDEHGAVISQLPQKP
jgi:hypothetical protein